MKKYLRKNRACYLGAVVFVLISTVFAVVLQFFKGDVLDCALAGDGRTTLRYAALLIIFILGEVLFYYLYRRSGDRFSVGCLRLLKHDIFAAILRQDYVAYKARPQGEYIARYTNEADTIRARYFQMLPLFWEILLKIVFVSVALFLLDWRIALITLALLTTPLYIPKLIERRLQKATDEYLKSVEDALARVNDWLNGFEIIKNFSVERHILSRFDASNDLSMDKLLRDTALGAAAQLITTLISYLSYFVVLAAATWLVLAGEFTAGNFFVAIGMIDQLSYPLISLAEIIRQLIAIKPTCAAIERFVSRSDSGANLSGGEKKRICLARALLRDTDVLILDEPLANLDEGTAQKIEELILSISGKLLLVVSHQFSPEKLSRFDGVIYLGK